MTCIYDVGTQLTFRSVRDEFNREREGSSIDYGLWIQMDLREGKKMEEKKKRGWGADKGKENEKEGETTAEEWGKIKVI